MEIIRSKTNKIITIMVLVVMFMSITFPIFAAYTDGISKGDKLKLTTDSWYIYKTETAAKNLDKTQTNGTLKKNDEFTVQAKNGNVLKIGDNKYIYYGSTGASSFKKISSASTEKTEVKEETKKNNVEMPSVSLSTVDFHGIWEVIKIVIDTIVSIIKGLFTNINLNLSIKNNDAVVEEQIEAKVDIDSKTSDKAEPKVETSSTGNNTISDANISKVGEFIGKFEGGTTTYTKNGVVCYKATKDTDGKMRTRGIDVSGLKSYGDNYYAKSDVDKKFNETVRAKANGIISKAKSKGLKLTENEVMALTSLAFQSSTTSVNEIMDTFKNEGKKAAMEKLLLYTKASGKNRGGLVKRRNAEATLLMEGSYNGKYNNDTKSDLKYYKKVLSAGYEFSYSGGPSQISAYKTKYNLVE